MLKRIRNLGMIGLNKNFPNSCHNITIKVIPIYQLLAHSTVSIAWIRSSGTIKVEWEAHMFPMSKPTLLTYSLLGIILLSFTGWFLTWGWRATTFWDTAGAPWWHRSSQSPNPKTWGPWCWSELWLVGVFTLRVSARNSIRFLFPMSCMQKNPESLKFLDDEYDKMKLQHKPYFLFFS